MGMSICDNCREPLGGYLNGIMVTVKAKPFRKDSPSIYLLLCRTCAAPILEMAQRYATPAAAPGASPGSPSASAAPRRPA